MRNMTAQELLHEIILTDPLYKKRTHTGSIPLTFLPGLNRLNFHCSGQCASIQTFAVSSVDNGQEQEYFEDLVALARMQAAATIGPGGGRFRGPRLVSNEAIYHLTLKCLKCNSYQIHFFLHFQPEKNKSGEIQKTVIQKVGQLPTVEDTLDADLEKWLKAKDKDLYKKGMRSEAHGFGIGAFGYFRRILENNIGNILDEIDAITDSQELRTAIAEAKKQHNAADRLDIIKDHVPASLMPNGQNVFTILYKALSKGLHQDSDDDCLGAATNIRVCLTFLIKKVNSAKEEAESVKRALKDLT